MNQTIREPSHQKNDYHYHTLMIEHGLTCRGFQSIPPPGSFLIKTCGVTCLLKQLSLLGHNVVPLITTLKIGLLDAIPKFIKRLEFISL
jgi:hypothetical protein